MATTEHIQSILDRMPHEPGVYQHFDADGKLLYIGKAKNLKKRVASYFTKQDHNGKTRLLVKKIRDVQWIVTASEADALLLENNMIKEHKPIYNIQLKDDKTYPFIVLKKERFPRIFPTRQVRKDGSEYFGPYSNVKGMHAVLDLCKKLYPIRTCSLALTEDNIAKGKFRVCLEYHIGNCMGPCVGKQTEDAYAESIAAIRHVLKGNLGEVKSALKTSMMAAAEDLRFEEAERLKLKLLAVDKFQAKSTVVHPTVSDVEVYGVVTDAKSAFVNFMRIHNGAVVQGQTLEFRRRLDESDVEILGGHPANPGPLQRRQSHRPHPNRNRRLWGGMPGSATRRQEEAPGLMSAQRAVRHARPARPARASGPRRGQGPPHGNDDARPPTQGTPRAHGVL